MTVLELYNLLEEAVDSSRIPMEAEIVAIGSLSMEGTWHYRYSTFDNKLYFWSERKNG